MPHNDMSPPAQATWDTSGRTVEAEGAQGHDPEQVTAIQLALVSLGYSLTGNTASEAGEDDGIDGQWNAGTREAVGQFQEDHDIEATGQLDDETHEGILGAYGQALVAGGADAMFDDTGDSLHMGQALTDNAAAGIDDLGVGALPDEPVLDMLDDVDATRKG